MSWFYKQPAHADCSLYSKTGMCPVPEVSNLAEEKRLLRFTETGFIEKMATAQILLRQSQNLTISR